MKEPIRLSVESANIREAAFFRQLIFTLRKLLGGKKIDMLQTRDIKTTFKQAPKAKVAVSGPEQLALLDDEG